MTERQIQLAILNCVHAACVVACPNYTPHRWWECDLWTVSKSGYATEYEVKLSWRDFRADREKWRNYWSRQQGEMIREDKHKRLEAGEPVGPSRFFYVFPEAIEAQIPMVTVPAWAGICISGAHRIWCKRDAPLLHRKKVSIREIRLAQRRMSYRYIQALRDMERMKRDAEQISLMQRRR